VTNSGQLATLPPGAREGRQRALDALALARRESIDFAAAARREGIQAEGAAWWLGDVARRERGRWRVAAADRLYRPMYAYSAVGAIPLDVRGSRAASTVGSYLNAVSHYLNTDDESRLARFRGVRI